MFGSGTGRAARGFIWRMACRAGCLGPPGARRLMLELGVVAVGGIVYSVVRKVTEGDAAQAVVHARRLFELEQRLGIDIESGLQQAALEHDWLRNLANWVYIYGHWPVITAVAIGLYACRRDRYVLLRNAVFLSGLIGFAFFAFVPMAPPRLAGLGFVDTVTQWSASYRVLQPPRYTNLYAAMPSLHFGWDLLAGMALFGATNRSGLRILAVALPLSMGFAVVTTANHFILDPIVGAIVVLLAWVTVNVNAGSSPLWMPVQRTHMRRNRRRRRAQRPAERN